jgi:DNA-binding LytR/AlgR family response regulator
MINAIAVDDEPLALDLIEIFCTNFDFIQYKKGFTKVGVAQKYLEKNPTDLLFLDINMPAMSGLEFFKSIEQKPMLIFTTSYSEFAVESYELGAIDYLLKPFTLARFEKAVHKAYDIFKLVESGVTNPRQILFKADYGVVKIISTNILFIEGLDNYVKIHLQNQHPIIVRMTMKGVMDVLPANEFIRVHRSYIVPYSKIETVRNKIIKIGAQEIPLSKSYENEFRTFFKK